MCKNRKGHHHSRVTNQKGVSGGKFAQRFLTESPRGCKATHTWSGANPPLGIAPECLCFSPTEQAQKAKVELQSVLRELLVHAGKRIYFLNIRSGKVVDGSGEWPVFISVPTGMWSLLFSTSLPTVMGEMTAGLDNL